LERTDNEKHHEDNLIYYAQSPLVVVSCALRESIVRAAACPMLRRAQPARIMPRSLYLILIKNPRRTTSEIISTVRDVARTRRLAAAVLMRLFRGRNLFRWHFHSSIALSINVLRAGPNKTAPLWK
jgi:hypothetical protein